MQVSQKHIADRLNVSISTVSKSLRTSADIPPKTRAQVMEIAAKLGYRPVSLRADKLNARQTPATQLSIGVMIQTDARIGSGLLHEATSAMIGITEIAHAADTSVNIHYVPLAQREQLLEPEFQPPALRRRQLHGLILLHYFPPEVVEGLAFENSVVTINHRYNKVDCVEANQTDMIEQMVDLLYEQGHRRIGFLGDMYFRPWMQYRFAGYVKGLAKYGIPYDPVIAHPRIDTAMDGVVDGIVHLTRLGVTAWIAGDDPIGYHWMDHFVQAGLKIPEDVSITGIDNLPPKQNKRLTSMRVPCEELGRAAIERLLARIQGPIDSPRVIQIKSQLMLGDTVAPPRTTVAANR